MKATDPTADLPRYRPFRERRERRDWAGSIWRSGGRFGKGYLLTERTAADLTPVDGIGEWP